jgi:F-type H+-transporting ATPase subunit a
MKQLKILFLLIFIGAGRIYSQDNSQMADNSLADVPAQDGHNHGSHSHDHDHGTHTHEAEKGPSQESHEKHEFDPKFTAFHHISDLNVYSIGPWNFPLPCILYAPDHGWSVFSSGKFHIDNAHHGSGHHVVDGYVLNHGRINRIRGDFPAGEAEVEDIVTQKEMVDGKEKEVNYAIINGQKFPLDKSSTADAGLFGGGITSFYDFSITKNVISMMLVFALLAWLFLSMAKNYKKAPGTAPKGAQLLMEPIILFLQEEVAKPFLGHKWERFFPMLLSIFFFVLGLNLFGQIPFLGGSNVTGNLSFTMVLALITFFVVNFNGNKHYWEHIFWMPGIPAWVKIILTPVEILGVLIKPLTLMLRLFANITAGHIAILIFISLIFIFGNSGANMGAGIGATFGSGLLTIFMMSIELLVALIQAFVFTILTASYIGAATEEHHH